MKLRLKQDPQEVFDVPRGVGVALLAIPGTPVEQVPAPQPKKLGPQKLSWSVRELTRTGKLCILVQCGTCSQSSTITDYTGTRKALHFCCGQGAPVPKEIAEEYRRLWLARQEDPRQVPRPLYLEDGGSGVTRAELERLVREDRR